MLINQILYGLDDVTIVPANISDIEHRSECNIKYSDGHYPIFAAPMDSVISKDNFDYFDKAGVIPIMPRTEPLDIRFEYAVQNKWAAFSLDEFKKYFINNPATTNIDDHDNVCVKALIDIANGHMSKVVDYIKSAKTTASEYNYDIEIMVGNIANPDTYAILADAGADYVRCSIGSGGCCLTASNTGIHYPMATLLDECRKIKIAKKCYNCKIVADGGISTYSRAIKALALGADYVMVGSTFAKAFESAAPISSSNLPLQDLCIKKHNILDASQMKDMIRLAGLTKTMHGMSTKAAQQAICAAAGIKAHKMKTSEGITKTINVEYTLVQWLDNFESYLKSCMSYTGKRDIYDFIGGVILKIMSPVAQTSFNK